MKKSGTNNKEKESLLNKLEKDPKAFLYASEELKNDPEVIKAAMDALDVHEGWARIKTEDGWSYYNPETGEIIPEA